MYIYIEIYTYNYVYIYIYIRTCVNSKYLMSNHNPPGLLLEKKTIAL